MVHLCDADCTQSERQTVTGVEQQISGTSHAHHPGLHPGNCSSLEKVVEKAARELMEKGKAGRAEEVGVWIVRGFAESRQGCCHDDRDGGAGQGCFGE